MLLLQGRQTGGILTHSTREMHIFLACKSYGLLEMSWSRNGKLARIRIRREDVDHLMQATAHLC